MLYESTYNQYFLEHSWGPWKKHMYISRDGESGKYTYKYPKDYYKAHRKWQFKKLKELDKKWDDEHKKLPLNPDRQYYEDLNAYWDEKRKVDEFEADKNSEFYNEYYSDFDKVINRSVKKAVDALNFAHDTRVAAEGYLNRFANAVKSAWNGAKDINRSRPAAGKKFVEDLWDYAKNTVTAKRISSSIQNLVQGAGEAISKTWNNAKDKAKTSLTKTVLNAKDKLVNKPKQDLHSRSDDIVKKKGDRVR